MGDAHDDAAETWGELGPPTEEELRDARALAEALEASRTEPGTKPPLRIADGPAQTAASDAAFLRSLAYADAPEKRPPLSEDLNDRLVERALVQRGEQRDGGAVRGRLIRVAFGGTLAFAAAALVLLAFGSNPKKPEEDGTRLAQSRSTQELFREPFRADQGSARIDRIAMARSGDLRENRFARWGVR